MRSMRGRRLVSVQASLLLLCVVASAAWVLSYWDYVFSSHGSLRLLQLDRTTARGDAEAYLLARPDHGKDVGFWFDLRRGFRNHDVLGRSLSLNATASSSWARLGFEAHRGTAKYEHMIIDASGNQSGYSGSFGFRLLAIPYWFLVLILATVPAYAWVAALRRRHRVRQGRCAGCGYDLRASSGRCPECGLPVGGGSRQTPEAVSESPELESVAHRA